MPFESGAPLVGGDEIGVEVQSTATTPNETAIDPSAATRHHPALGWRDRLCGPDLPPSEAEYPASDRYPELGEMVTPTRGAALSRRLGFDKIAARIAANPDAFVSWEFDGASGVPDRLLGIISGPDWREITYKAALPHDLAYAYGKSGDAAAREKADEAFLRDLIDEAGMNPGAAWLYHFMVRVGGGEALGLPWSWGFANKEE